jgi:hypothetical protein
MKSNNNGKPGFRTTPKIDRLREVEHTVANMGMAMNVFQLGMKQMIGNFKSIDEDMKHIQGMLNDFQYRLLAIVDTLKLDKDALNLASSSIRLHDYQEASDADDKKNNYETIDTVEDNSVVIVTSECPEAPDKALFRSKFSVTDLDPKQTPLFIGKKVGDKFELDLVGNKHAIEILGVRRPPKQEEPPKIEETSKIEETDGNDKV